MRTHPSRCQSGGRIFVVVFLAAFGFLNAGGLSIPFSAAFPCQTILNHPVFVLPASKHALSGFSKNRYIQPVSVSKMAASRDRQKSSIEKLINSKWQTYQALAISS